MLELVRARREPEDLVRQFEPSAQAIRNWVRQADRGDWRRQDGLAAEERQEHRRPTSPRLGVGDLLASKGKRARQERR
jgi:transposase-like protein